VDQAGAQAAAASTSGVPSEAEAGRDPSATVQEFYTLVARHDFTDAANLWSPRMRAAYPPQQNIDGRFSQTQDVTVRQAQVISNPGGGGQAVVAVDLVESTAAGSRRWIGNWYLVRGPGGWLLDQPQLQSP
jgi:hypothetical protein